MFKTIRVRRPNWPDFMGVFLLADEEIRCGPVTRGAVHDARAASRHPAISDRLLTQT